MHSYVWILLRRPSILLDRSFFLETSSCSQGAGCICSARPFVSSLSAFPSSAAYEVKKNEAKRAQRTGGKAGNIEQNRKGATRLAEEAAAIEADARRRLEAKATHMMKQRH